MAVVWISRFAVEGCTAMQKHVVSVVSHLAELGIFLAAAAAVGAGLLSLR